MKILTLAFVVTGIGVIAGIWQIEGLIAHALRRSKSGG
jgi:hypothetical protein